MKALILLLILAITTQPIQAGFCDMEADQQAPQPMEQMEHGSHDCCDPEQSESQQNCDGEIHCGFCGAVVSAVPGMPGTTINLDHLYSPKHASGAVLPSHSHPLLRPPIS